MRKESAYRFTLQFPAQSPAQQQVGDFLEQLGSKKSRLVVQVLAAYLEQHPELLKPGSKIQFAATQPAISKDELRQLIREVIAENGVPVLTSDPAPEDGVAAMLENMGIFG